jgi:hypothetical protein
MPEENLLIRVTCFAFRRNRMLVILSLIAALACNKLDEFTSSPELDPLDQGFKSTAAIAYCTSLATRAFNGETLPPNVVFNQTTTPGYSGSGLLYVSITEDDPLPLNDHIGDIVIAGLWDGLNGGVISIVFADIDVLSGESKFYGIHTIPVIKKNNGEVVTLFAEQDIVIGEGSDTLLQLGLSKAKFASELERLDSEKPTDVFVAVTQNVWHITLHQNLTSGLSESYEVTGGGQILSASNSSGGVLYHAMINTQFNFADCPLNPVAGTAFIQNLQAGSSLDFGNILLEFHSSCTGKAEVKLATGKYVSANGKDLSLNWN